MFDVKFDANKRRLLRALSHVKDTRKSLAEAEYLRRRRMQNDLHQKYTVHAERLQHCQSALPQQKSAILAELAAQPVGMKRIHSAHDAVRKLHDRIDALDRERKELENTHRQACADEDLARASFTDATRRQQKFQTIRSRNDAQAAQQSNEREQADSEDRSHTHTNTHMHTDTHSHLSPLQ